MTKLSDKASNFTEPSCCTKHDFSTHTIRKSLLRAAPSTHLTQDVHDHIPSTLNVSNFFSNSNKNRKPVSSPFLSSPLCEQSVPCPEPVRVLGCSPQTRRRCSTTACCCVRSVTHIDRARSAALPGGLTLCSGFKTEGRKGTGVRKGGLERAMTQILHRMFMGSLGVLI